MEVTAPQIFYEVHSWVPARPGTVLGGEVNSGIVNVNVKGMWKSFIRTIVAHVFSNNRQLIVWKRIQTRNLFSNLLSHPLIHYFFSSSNIQIMVWYIIIFKHNQF